MFLKNIQTTKSFLPFTFTTKYLFSTSTTTNVSQQYSPLRLQLIKKSLANVHKYGWSDNAILAACSGLELSAASHRLIKPYDMISYSMRNWNRNALRKIDDHNFQGNKRIRDKIHYAIKTRLQQQLEYIDTWNQAMGIGASPQNIIQTKNILWEYSDQIWRRCGDTATDYNYYTKRILFNTAYATTQLHLLTDQSVGKEESWKFLERRLDDILQMGKGISDLKTVGGAAIDGMFNLFTMFRQPTDKDVKNPIDQMKIHQNINIQTHQANINEQIKAGQKM